MFANLKNKLIEEVKASPSKFQQFATAAQAAVSSSTPNSSDTNTSSGSGTNENFFSITEEDTPQNSPYRIQKLPTTSASSLRGRSSTQSLNGLGGGAVPRSRKLSNSSMASDVSFRLPSYDAPAVYHLQSDLDETSSEFDDSASTARLDVITKDQLYDAYKKSLDRYHKYRCRYTDLAKKYKELERDSTKARSVLVETQDKALRRISELREQCTLEQQAKAHLEEALRIEMDDMSCKMQAYQTKLKLLGENPENISAALERVSQGLDSDKLIDLEESAGGRSPPPANGDLTHLQQRLEERQAQFEEMTGKYEALRKQEEENVLLLAQTKQAIHTELEHKDIEVRQLQEKLKQYESQRESQTSDVKDQLKKLLEARQEADAKLIATEHILSSLRGEHAAKEQQVVALEKQLAALKAESETKLNELRQQSEQLGSDQLKKLQVAKEAAESKLLSTEELLNALKVQHSAKEEQVVALEKQMETFKAESESQLNELRQQSEERGSEALKQLQVAKEKAEAQLLSQEELLNSLKMQHTAKEEQVETLEQQLAALKAESETKLKELRQHSEERGSEQLQKLQVAKEEAEAKLLSTEELLKTLNLQHTAKEEQLETLKAETDQTLHQLHADRESESNAAKAQLQELQLARDEAEAKLLSTEQLLVSLRGELAAKNEQAAALEEEVNALKTDSELSLQDLRQHNDQLLEIVQRSQQNDFEGQLQQTKDNVAALEGQLVERERQTLELEKSLEIERESVAALISEKTSLEEQHKLRLEQLQREIQMLQDQHASTESETISALKAQLETLNQELGGSRASLLAKEKELKASGNKLNKLKKQHEQQQAKTSEHTARMEQLQKEMAESQSVARHVENEKEELQARVSSILEEITSMQTHLQQVQDSHGQLESENRELESRIEAMQQEQQGNNAHGERTTAKMEEIQSENSKLAERNCLLEEQTNHLEKQLQLEQEELAKVQAKMQQVLDEHSKLQNAQELMDHDHRTLQDKCDAYEKETLLNKDALECLQSASEELQQAKANLERELAEQQSQLLELRERQREQEQQVKDQAERCSELEASHLESDSQAQATIQNLRHQIDAFREAEQGVQDRLQAAGVSHASQMAILEARWSAANADVERLHEANDALQLAMDQQSQRMEELQEILAQRDRQLEHSEDSTKKLAKYDEIQVENEYLHTHTKQLEQELADNAELKEKLKSMQCELYVLQEQVEHHATQVTEKEAQSATAKAEAEQLRTALEEQTLELTRQREHASFVTEQSDAVQTELLQTQQQLQERQSELAKAQEEHISLQAAIAQLHKEVASLKEQPAVSVATDADSLRSLNEQLQRELEGLKHKSNGAESNMQQEIEELQANNQQMAERINELEALRAGIQAQQLLNSMAPKHVQEAAASSEKAVLESKLKEIMNEVQDVTNRNLFLEQKCENFLILEQSNERLKLQNAKLSRQLDETLVSMQHSDTVPVNTEFEYLRNIMFQYLTGTTNNETLVKVISAVLKFSPQQSQVALEKEHQRRSLLNKLI
ncbi:golgin subfamily A member 4 [Drosophila subobscura]|uniref:golgin subfamily A member 4 n=1 Tax=Drosophila subobscura TaxID=7241 RepID=UPI00155A460F|nr:golgin subfamily A member 4 [Drosophila subobscura]